jgi:tRNA nucleotidyltransferase/poly(A) polymerase
VPAVVAGGAVRDILMGDAPADFDLAVGIGTLDILELFPGSVQSRNVFGTVAVTWDGVRLELTPLRNFGATRQDSPFWEVNLGR